MTDTELPPILSPDHQRLAIFVGNWQAEGRSYGDDQDPSNPYDAAVTWTSEETYEWLPGGFFLIHRWNARVGEHDFIGIEILGYDASSGEYTAHAYDNGGFSPTYWITNQDNQWTVTGEAQRATIVFSESGREMKLHWEWKTDEVTWLPLCDRTATKIG